jgi:hypothetical protein
MSIAGVIEEVTVVSDQGYYPGLKCDKPDGGGLRGAAIEPRRMCRIVDAVRARVQFYYWVLGLNAGTRTALGIGLVALLPAVPATRLANGHG